MSHKNKIMAYSLGVLGLVTAVSFAFNKAPVSASAATEGNSGNWYWLNTNNEVTFERIDGGYAIDGLNAFGARAMYSKKIAFDGLSFTVDTPNMADQLGDARGFYVTNKYQCYFDDTTNAMVGSIWSLFGQMRFYLGADHNYNNDAAGSYGRGLTDDSIKGLSPAGGQLVSNYNADFSLNFKFEKLSTEWWKLTMSGANVWKDVNYNGSAGSAFTYIHAEDMHLDENDMGYLGFFGLNPHANEDLIKVTGLDITEGLEIAKAPTKVSYQYGEEFDASGIEINEVKFTGEKTAVSSENLKFLGFDKNTVGKQTITVSANGYSATFEVEVKNKVSGIALSGTPKVEYNYGESLDLSTFKIAVSYVNGDVIQMDVTEDMISGFDKKAVGKQSLSISYDDYMVQVDVEVKDVVKAISVKTMPTKVEYEIGEELNVIGGELEVEYESGVKKTLSMTSDMVSGFDSSEAGEVTLTVTYNGFSSTFDVTIKAATPAPQQPETNNGCGGSVVAVSGMLSLLALAGATLVASKRKH